MINGTLYRRGIKGSIKIIVILCAVISIYVPVIISMYDPKLAKLLDSYVKLLPNLMSAVGMTAGATSLISFMSSYLYGFILVIFPMLFCIFRANALIAKYVDNSSMVSLLAAPVRRRTVAFTQAAVLITGIMFLILFCTVLEWVCAEHYFPGQLDAGSFLKLNLRLLSLQLFIGGICFLASCIFSEVKYSIGFGVGIPVAMYATKMLVNMGGMGKKARFFTFFTLFNPEGIVSGKADAIAGVAVLLAGSLILFGLGIAVFCKKDLHI